MSRARRQRRRRANARRILRNISIGVIAAQLGAVGVIYALDAVRKKRVPGGAEGFPALPPADTVVGTSELRSYTEGQTLYQDMLTAIEEAKDYIFFETYVWRADKSGHAFKDALIAAAERGVRVNIIFDGFGNLNQNPAFKKFPKLPNLHVHRLAEVRIGLLTLNARRTGRTHRKVLVVDGKVGFVGGFNIGDDFGIEWRDTHLRISGPDTVKLANGFVTFWNLLRRPREVELKDCGVVPWQSPISAAFNLPARLLFPIRGEYLDALDRAQENVYLTTPYFIPDREFSTALLAAAERGVQIRILLPEFSNHILADWVARPFLGPLLRGGVEIWLYQHAMIHSKTMTVDGIWSTVGTANIDRLSMMGNAEVNLQIVSPEFAARMEEIFYNDLTTARQLNLSEWENRSLTTKIMERLLRPFNVIV